MSLINAIAGAYAEYSPVVHIVGTPALPAQESGACLHHTLGDGRFRVFAEMAAKVTVAQANLVDPGTAVDEINRVLAECIHQSRPVYIELPTTSVKIKVPSSALEKPLRLKKANTGEGLEDTVVDQILDKIYAAKQPLIIVDGLTRRFGLTEEVDALVSVTGFPTVSTPFGKGILDESLPSYRGVYAGVADKNTPKSWVDARDLVLKFAPLDSDVNTFGFSTLTDTQITTQFHKYSVEVGGSSQHGQHHNLDVKYLLRKVLARLDPAKIPRYDAFSNENGGGHSSRLKDLPSTKAEDALTQNVFWPRMSAFLRPRDVILTDAATSLLGITDMILPPESMIINSVMWASIGFAVGAAQGVSIALQEMLAKGTRSAGRTILFEGDGSFQMTVQAISDIIRNRLDIILFVINNDGYTVERHIHGLDARYNDIQSWRYLEAPSFFGAPQDDPSYPVVTLQVATWAELDKMLADETVRAGKGLVMVELIFGRYDCLEVMTELLRSATKRNGGETATEFEAIKSSPGENPP